MSDVGIVGIVGKTNVGKTTFFSAATLIEAEIGDRPFVTIRPNEGVGHVRVKSVCTEFGVECEPRFGWCNRRYRYVPVKLMDVAGLVPGAHQGKGLGNKFLDDLRRASVHILIVDCSGGTDDEGNPSRPGTHDPLRDAVIVKEEFAHWIMGIVKKNMSSTKRRIQVAKEKAVDVLADMLSGLGIAGEKIVETANELGLSLGQIGSWEDDHLFSFSSHLREKAKPMVIAANKMDIPEAEDNLDRLREGSTEVVVPTSAEAELVLRRAAAAGLVRYQPGDRDFEIVDESRLSSAQVRALKMIEEAVIGKYGSTGVQEALDRSVFDVTGMRAIFPVENEMKLSDKDGRVLPDVFLLEPYSDLRTLAGLVHSEVAERAFAGLDARSKKRVSLSQKPKHRDVMRILMRHQGD